jgi:hypothetical protein
MTKPNTNFELSVQDIDIIEQSLRSSLSESHKSGSERKQIHELLGKLHSQKNWYRPKNTYIGG